MEDENVGVKGCRQLAMRSETWASQVAEDHWWIFARAYYGSPMQFVAIVGRWNNSRRQLASGTSC